MFHWDCYDAIVQRNSEYCEQPVELSKCIALYMFRHVNFCYFLWAAWLYKKYPSKTKLLQRHSMRSRFSIHGYQTFITLYETRLTSPIASTEREPITFRRQAWWGVTHIMLWTCVVQYVYQYHIPQVCKILRWLKWVIYFSMVYLVWYLALTVICVQFQP